MADDAHLKRKAVELRKGGMALDEIVLRLAFPRTTIYGWVRELPIERTAKQSEAQKRGSQAGQKKAARAREAIYKAAWLEAPELLHDQKYAILLCSTWLRGTDEAVIKSKFAIPTHALCSFLTR